MNVYIMYYVLYHQKHILNVIWEIQPNSTRNKVMQAIVYEFPDHFFVAKEIISRIII